MFSKETQEADLVRCPGTTTTHYDAQVSRPVSMNGLGWLFCTTQGITLHEIMFRDTSEPIRSLATDEWSPYRHNAHCDKA